MLFSAVIKASRLKQLMQQVRFNDISEDSILFSRYKN